MYYISDIQDAIPEAKVQFAKKLPHAGIGIATDGVPAINTMIGVFYAANMDNVFDLWFSIVDELIVRS